MGAASVGIAHQLLSWHTVRAGFEPGHDNQCEEPECHQFASPLLGEGETGEGAGREAALACNGSFAAPTGADLGDCPEVLQSGSSCEPQCQENSTLTANTTCQAGNLSVGTCVASTTTSTSTTGLFCDAGEEYLGNDDLRCEYCRKGTYKAFAGVLPCSQCPPGSSTNFLGANSAASCRCNSTTYSTRSADGSLETCTQCPSNSHILEEGHNYQESAVSKERRRWSKVNESIEYCTCKVGFLPERDNSSDNKLLYCRRPHPCNLTAWIPWSNLTGPQEHKLSKGTCANISQLQSEESCTLLCMGAMAPQTSTQTDLFYDVSTKLSCLDGEIVDPPPPGIWCSRTAWELPPLVFLGTTAIATLTAACMMERRERLLDAQLTRAFGLEKAN